MTVSPISPMLVATALALSLAAQKSNDNPTHLDFSLVRGSIGNASSQAGGEMTDAPFTVLSFTGTDEHTTLVVSDARGDYTAALEPGHYCVFAYNVKTGVQMALDSRQLKCINIVARKDVRLDIMLRTTR